MADAEDKLPRPREEIHYEGVPAGYQAAHCSLRTPVCVWSDRASDAAYAARVIREVDEAWQRMTLLDIGLRPIPAGDSLRILLADAATTPEAIVRRSQLDGMDAVEVMPRVPRGLGEGCDLGHSVARALSFASLSMRSPAMGARVLSALGDALAELLAPCESHREVRFATPLYPAEMPAFVASVGCTPSLFIPYLEARFARYPGDLIVGLAALSATRTPSGETSWASTPNLFDVLGHTLGARLGASAHVPELLLSYALARYRPDYAAGGQAAQPRLDVDVPWPSPARRFHVPLGVEPTGLAYVKVDTRGIGAGGELSFEVTWEHYARMRWGALKVSADGAIEDSLVVTSPSLHGVQGRVAALSKASSVVLVGVSLPPFEGLVYPERPWEPHAYVVTLSGE